MTRITYPIAFKLEALKLLETLSDYKVAALINVARRTLRNWQKQCNELLAYKGNKKNLKVRPGRQPEQFPDLPGLVQCINDLRGAERALTTMHIINWIKRNQRTWLLDYLSIKAAGSGYKSLLQLLRRFCRRHGFSRQRLAKSKKTQGDLSELRDEFALEFHRSYSAHSKECTYNVDETGFYYDMPPHYIWAVRGGSSKISAGEKHSMRMTAVLTVRADGIKLPIMFIMKGQPGGRIETNEVPTFPEGHFYAVHEKAWMDARAHVSEESTKIVQEELGSHLCAMPPNATSVCQPLDVGVMAPFKRHLRELWLYEEMIDSDDEDPDSVTAKQKRLAMIKRAIAAWDLVTPEIVRGSFEKALACGPTTGE
ncbi:hypothetical protein DYB36_011325 [Aphanomyces astaci]|uniref:DDE-1 domain-containing protein n=1 Tax=Aphanomyces astaci TaxID=112090 RepID=A0A397BKZ2_APHAT|nr:hypothetical protein DYB36_011325 [Aphanomyces astaci]